MELLEKAKRAEIDERTGIADLLANRGNEPFDRRVQEWNLLERKFSGALHSRTSGPESLYVLSRVYQELAQLTAEQLRELEPNSYRSHQLLGEAYEGKEDYSKALKEFEIALQISPNAPGLHYSIGHAYWKMLRFEEALPEMEKELSVNPNNASANYVLGHILLYRRQTEKACHYLQAAVKAQPDFIEARKQWGKALSLLNDNSNAARQLERAAALDPEGDSVHYLLAGVYKKLGLHEKAKAELETFTRLRALMRVHDKSPK